MTDIMEIVKSFEDYGLLTKGVTSTTENEAKEKKDSLVCYYVL